MSADDHKRHAPRRVRVYFLTVSDTRTEENDSSGQLARKMIAEAGHECVGHSIVRDEPAQVQEVLKDAVTLADVIISSGGTGISSRDTTYEAVTALLEKKLDGFGELFRMLSYAEIGAPAMLSRATAGLYRGAVIFCTPGSSAAVRLALEKLILPELGHLKFETHR